ncbi:MAG: lipopolysaccharide biosynthesis protein [Anaerolineae bacterium]
MRSISALQIAKYRKRALTVVANSVNSLLLPVFNIVVSFLVIRFASVELWGEFVNLLIIAQFGAHIVSWGNKEYLLRRFSFNPARIAAAWQTSFITRLALFALLSLVLLLAGFSRQRTLLMILWSFSLVFYQSYEVVILYNRAFVFAALVELSALALPLAAITILGPRLAVDHLLWLFGLTTLAKALVFLVRFRRQTVSGLRTVRLDRFQPGYFRLAFPFFLLGFSGLLQSRIDLYAVNYFLSERDVGQYQVFINFMIYLQALAAFTLLPFVKSIYRLSYRAILKISMRLFGLGIVIVVPALAVAHLALTRFYHFQLPFHFLVFGGLFALPVYFYSPVIYGLFKANQESVVIKVSFLGAGINFLLNVILLPQVGLVGAIIASAAVQWLTFFIYLGQSRALRAEDALMMPGLP